MTQYTYFAGDDQITLINLATGNRVTMYSDDSRFTHFKELVQIGDYAAAENLDTKTVVTKFGQLSDTGRFCVTIENGVGKVSILGQEYPLEDAVTNRIIKMSSEGFSATPLVNFLEKVYSNPSHTAVKELFLFQEQCELPITADGDLIAYKIVKDDYTDIYTGKMDNSIGKVVEMPRFAVDDNRSNTCSSGLHFCSRSYLTHYGSSNRDNDRCLLVKINPADVVSIPNDYNNAKGRTCRYEVVSEINDAEWRKILAERDYTTYSVVDDDGDDFDDDSDFDCDEEDDYQSSSKYDAEDAIWANLNAANIQFNYETERWYYAPTGKMVSKYHAAAMGGCTLEELASLV